jgi:hypothetical protein
MKRFITALLPLVLLTVVALTSQTLILASGTHAPSAVTGASATIPHLQLNGSSIPEPVSIMLSSLALLGWTTFLRRNRLNRRT